MDREADCFAVFDEQRRLNRVEVLVRAHHDRCLAKGAPKLFAAMRAGAADGHVEIEIDRLSARRKSNGRQARPARTGRVARAEVRHRQVVAPPTIAGAEPVALSTVHVRETAPPPGEPAVEWFLLTSLDVDSTETAVLDEAGGLVPGFALPAPRGTGEEPVAGLAAVSAPCAAAAAAEGDGAPRAAAGLADFGAERPGSGDDPATALGGAAGGLANRLEQQPSVGGPTLETGAGAVGESYCRRDEASPAGHRFTLPAASFVSWFLACSSTQVSPTGA